MKLTNEQYVFIKKLFQITRTILEDYDRLHNLEINGRKNSSEYDATLESLKFNLHLEEEMYEEIEEDVEFIYLLEEYVAPGYIPSLEGELEIIKSENKDDIVKLRILGRIGNIINKEIISADHFLGRFDSSDDESPFDIEDQLDELPDEIDMIAKSYQGLKELDISIEKDLVNAILYILNIYINDPQYSKYKDRLLKMKYNIAFIYRNVEDYLVENNMEINPTLYIESKLTLDINGCQPSMLFKRMDLFKGDIIFTQVNDLFKLITEEMDEQDKEFNMIIIKLLLRVCFMFGNAKEIRDFQKSTNEDFESAEIKTSLVDDLANELIKHLPNDVAALNIIHLAPYLK